jgi:hypothetical protein
VAAASDSLEQIIRDELRQPVAELVRQVVRELVHEQLNGAAESAVSGPENGQEPRLRPGPKAEASADRAALQPLRRDEAGRRVRARAWHLPELPARPTIEQARVTTE